MKETKKDYFVKTRWVLEDKQLQGTNISLTQKEFEYYSQYVELIEVKGKADEIS